MNKNESFMSQALKADEQDPLRHYRSRFKTNDNLIYLDGNSLGMMPLASKKAVTEIMSHDWGKRLIRGWNENWWMMPQRVSGKLSQLLGCDIDEVAVCDSTSVNLYKLIRAAIRMQRGRKKIVSDDLNFPSDLYIIQGVISDEDDRLVLELAHGTDGVRVDYDHLFEKIDKDTAVVVLSYVSFRSAFMYDMKRVTDYAHEKGALVIWDLSHATGAVEIDLDNAGADMAVGCTYKYLNGGPGSPAFLYVNKKIQDSLISPIWAWLGEHKPFEFSLDYRPSGGARKYMTGTPNILSLSTLEPAIDIILEAGMDNIRKKSLRLSAFLLELFHDILAPMGFELGSPERNNERGSHVSIKHSEGYGICKTLIDENKGDFVIIPDFRPPDNIRLGLSPLYNSFEEVLKAVTEIEKIVKNNLYESYDTADDAVT
ncbi:MAG: kynureninase [Bacteroidales bacterium]|nr:kynureninase [Bacteroidales bacterium]